MADRQKSIVAALLAVHSGRISPDEAAAALEDPEKAPTLMEFDAGLPTVTLSSHKGPRIATLPEVLGNPKLQKQALREIGIGDTVQKTLFEYAADGDTGRRVIRDTLQAVASTGRDLNARGGFQPAGDDDDMDGETHVPSEVSRRTLRLTTGRFFPNFGIQSERYEVKKEHARGGMGRVMLAKDRAVGREVALKELLPGMATGSIPASVPAGVTDSGGIVERFLREARITGQLEHPNIVPVYEIGQNGDGSFYYTMRFIRGRTLADRLREIRKDAALTKVQKLALRIKLLDQFIDVCNAIAYAHSRGVINRDIKPENIMLGDFGETLVLDWGLARLKGQEDKALDDLRKGTLALSKSLLDADSEALTLDGSIVGTPAYMAPEQARGELEAVDERSDVYSLGAVLYQILTGYPPYEGPMAALIVQSVLAGPPVAVRSREPNVPRELVALVDRAMAREKEDRLPSALELAREVKAFRDGRTLGSYSYTPRELVTRFWRQNRTAAGIAVLGFLLVVAAVVFFMQRLTDERDAAQSARFEAEREQQSATNALKVAQQERDERARIEKQAADRAREEYQQRLREAERVLGTIEGMRIGPAMEDLQSRLTRYDAELKGPPQRKLLELSPAEQTGNSVLLSTLLGYISARQNLLELLNGPAGAELPETFRKFDLAAERRELDDLRLRTGQLARINGEFNLAEFLIAGSTLSQNVLERERAETAGARDALLNLHAERIEEAVTDVRGGIGRAGRDPGAPTVSEYIRRLSQYREAQTVDRLESELDRLVATPPEKWTRAHVHVAVLVCRVLGNVEQPARTVPMLGRLLDKVNVPEAVEAASEALGDTDSAEAVVVLLRQVRKRGIDYWQQVSGAIAGLPMPVRLRDPRGLQDHLDLAFVLRSRGDTVGAIDSATRALNLSEGYAEALLVRGLARADAGARDEALADLSAAAGQDALKYEALLARANARNVYTDGEAAIEDLTTAINADPQNPRGWVHRGRVYSQRARFQQALEDYRKAVELAPGNIAYRLEFGEQLRASGRPFFADAEAEFTKVIEQAPDDWRGWSARCVLRRDTAFGGCIEDGLEATRLNPQDARAWNHMAQSYYGIGRIPEGVEAATNAVKADPQEWMAFYYRGILYLRMQDAEDARARDKQDATYKEARRINLERVVSDFRSVVAIAPDDFRSWALMADALIGLDRYDEARAACVSALSLAPFDGEQSTIGMHNWGVRRNLLEIDGAAWAGRTPDTIPAMVRLAHYHMRRAERPRAPISEFREPVIRIRQARASAGEQTSPIARYELAGAELRLASLLLEAEYFAEMAKVAQARVQSNDYVTPLDWFNLARAHAGLSRQYLEGRVKLLGADDAELQAAQSELNALSPAQRRERSDELADQCRIALAGAVAAGFKDVEAARREEWFRHLQQEQWWGEWVESAEKSTAQPPQDPGAPTPIAVLSHVTEGGPAWQAGLRELDVVVQANGVAVSSTAEFIGQLRQVEPGVEYAVVVRRYELRDGRLVMAIGPDGARVVDESGLPVWKYTEHTLQLRGGFLGIRIDDCALPSPLDP